MIQIPNHDRALTPAERRKLRAKKTGHASPVGTGPEGETCGSCQHHVGNEMRSGKTYYKCALMRSQWTGGPGSDIRLKDAACRHWEAA